MLQKGLSLIHCCYPSSAAAAMAAPRTGAYLMLIPYALIPRNMTSNGPENNGKGYSFTVAASKEEGAANHGGSGSLQWDSILSTPYASRRREMEPSRGFNASYFSKGNTSNTGFKHGMYRNPMEFVRGVLVQDSFQVPKFKIEQNPDIVHIKILRNNTFVTVTDSKGNRKVGATSGLVPELKGNSKMSRYAAEATAEFVGRKARDLGLKSVVVKVNGFTYFKKKKQAILSFRDGFASSQIGPSPIVHIEDTTQRPHNGCRKPKRRRV